MFSQVCVCPWAGVVGCPLASDPLVPGSYFFGGGGYLLASGPGPFLGAGGGVYLSQACSQGYLPPDRTGYPYPLTGYAAGGRPLAVTKEDFLVFCKYFIHTEGMILHFLWYALAYRNTGTHMSHNC